MINFIKKRRLWYSFSLFFLGIGILFMVKNFWGLNHVFNLGIDFTGGTSITIRFDKSHNDVEFKIRSILKEMNLNKHIIQMSGQNDISIKLEEINIKQRNQLFNKIEKAISPFTVLEVDVIGPSIGEELRKTSILIIIAVSIAILIYCSWRFDMSFGLAAILALLHDFCILLSFTAMLKLEVNTVFIAALLTVLGYSINDTIVIFDRIRDRINENKSKDEVLSKLLVNTAVNEMIPRSIHTSLTTGIVIMSIFLLAGAPLKVFSTVLLIGLVTGTYSSLFIASPLMVTISKLKGVKIEQ